MTEGKNLFHLSRELHVGCLCGRTKYRWIQLM